jgi:hypothetical protein
MPIHGFLCARNGRWFHAEEAEEKAEARRDAQAPPRLISFSAPSA